MFFPPIFSKKLALPGHPASSEIPPSHAGARRAGEAEAGRGPEGADRKTRGSRPRKSRDFGGKTMENPWKTMENGKTREKPWKNQGFLVKTMGKTMENTMENHGWNRKSILEN